MASEIHGILYNNVHSITGDNIQSTRRGDEFFLKKVISPIYDVLRKVQHLPCMIYSIFNLHAFVSRNYQLLLQKGSKKKQRRQS